MAGLGRKPSRLREGVGNRKFPKVVTRGYKRSFAPRKQRSPESLLHLPKPVLLQCNPILHKCKRLFACWFEKTFCTLSSPLPGMSYFRPPLSGGLVCKVWGYPALKKFMWVSLFCLPCILVFPNKEVRCMSFYLGTRAAGH